jgi:hypothetical protein
MKAVSDQAERRQRAINLLDFLLEHEVQTDWLIAEIEVFDLTAEQRREES